LKKLIMSSKTKRCKGKMGLRGLFSNPPEALGGLVDKGRKRQ